MEIGIQFNTRHKELQFETPRILNIWESAKQIMLHSQNEIFKAT